MTDPKKSPAFQFYPDDWLTDRIVAMMTPEQEGAYIRLVCYCWLDNDLSLPDNDEQLTVLSRLSKGGLELVKSKFVKHPTKEGFLTHSRLQKEYKKQCAWRKKSAKGGKNSASQRADKKQKSKGGSKMVGHCLVPKGNTPSPSPSPSPTVVEEKRDTNVSTKKQKIGFEELEISHVSEWLEEKRTSGKYLTIDEEELLEMFKDYCRSKAPKYKDYIAAFRNSFKWENVPKKGNGHDKPTYHERVKAAGDRGVAKVMADWEARNPRPDDTIAITDKSEL